MPLKTILCCYQLAFALLTIEEMVRIVFEKSIDKWTLCLVYKRDCFLETTAIY